MSEIKSQPFLLSYFSLPILFTHFDTHSDYFFNYNNK